VTPAAVIPPDELELVVTPPAGPALSSRLPEPVASAVIEFLTTALVKAPLRVDEPLRADRHLASTLWDLSHAVPRP
jgi:hypothetical protein